jgi:Putative Actinobacterial Holin-X, holin superfamily III
MPIPATETRTRTAREPGVGPAAKEVAEHASALARLELRLALLELKQKLTALGLGIGLAVGGAILALFALGFGLGTVAAALATALSTWLALLIVTAGLLLVSGVLGLLALRTIKKGVPPVPEQAIAEAKRTSEAVKADGSQRNT